MDLIDKDAAVDDIEDCAEAVQQDRKFLIDVLFLIRDYARANDMDEDETIKTVAENMLSLLKIATFKVQKAGEKE